MVANRHASMFMQQQGIVNYTENKGCPTCPNCGQRGDVRKLLTDGQMAFVHTGVKVNGTVYMREICITDAPVRLITPRRRGQHTGI